MTDKVAQIAAKPTLHEIAAMPFPASQEAMRKHYDKNWHCEQAEVDEDGKRKFRVRFSWEISGDFDEEVEAEDEDEAEEIAREMALDDACSSAGDIDIHFVRVTPADPKELKAQEAYRAALADAS